MPGLNILAQFLDDRNVLLNYIKQNSQSSYLVMDDPNLARQIKALVPKSLVVHRTYNENDPHWHDRKADGSWVFPPEQWVMDHKATVSPGILLQVFNEPNPVNKQDFMNWLIQVCTIAKREGIVLAVCNWSVGNPLESDIDSGLYDPLIRAIVQNGHYLAVHEYFREESSKEPELIGRYKHWLNRAKILGLTLKLTITEFGTDFGTGSGGAGYKGKGWSEQQYYDKMLYALNLYFQDDIHPNIFCYGYGAGHQWDSFNIEHAETLKTLITQYNKDHTMTPIPVPSIDRSTLGTPVEMIVRQIPATYVNIRSSTDPTSPIVGKMYKNDQIVARPKLTPVINGYSWYAMEQPVVGWFANIVIVEITAADTPVKDLKPGYVSQIDLGADIANNDCGYAALLELMRYNLVHRGLHQPTLPTVDDLVVHTRLVDLDEPQQFSDLINLASNFGFTAHYIQPADVGTLTNYIKNDVLVLALGNYRWMHPLQVKDLGHFFVIRAYGEFGFWIDDPWKLGPHIYYKTEQLQKIMTQLGKAGSLPYQILILE